MQLRPFSRLFGLILIGDGMTALRAPRRYLRQLQNGTPIIDDLLEFFAREPKLTRKISLVEVGIGAWLLLRP